jgi:thiol-disulfide isomerase/thioredoxin
MATNGSQRKLIPWFLKIPQIKTPAIYCTASSRAEAEILLQHMKPLKSRFFNTGSKFGSLNLTDIHGNKVQTKGKITVINYWFINCPPCQKEIPKLNEVVKQFETNTDVVFVAIALDAKDQLEQFLKSQKFNYQVVANGKYLANEHKINAFPTHVIIDKTGKVIFHCMGYTNSIGYWLEKYIEESK